MLSKGSGIIDLNRKEDSQILGEVLPYDTIFEILSFLRMEDQLSIASTSKRWAISIAARSDRLWGIRYDEERKKSACSIDLPKHRMKKISRRKTCLEKYAMLRHQNQLFLEEVEIKQFKEIIKLRDQEEKRRDKKRKVRRKRKAEENIRRVTNKEKGTIKCVFVGDGAVGKTCLLHVYASEDRKFPTDYVPTVYDHHDITVKVDGKDIGLGLWDTAGSLDYESLRPLSYRDAVIFVVLCACSNPVTLDNTQTGWFPELRKHEPEVPIILCMTKIDLRENKDVIEELADSNQVIVTREEGIKACEELTAYSYFETSALTGKGVKEFFDGIIFAAMSGLRDKERPGGDEKCVVM